MLDLMWRTLQATAVRLQGPHPPGMNEVSFFALALHFRCYRLLNASYLLMKWGFVHEAVILGRPLFSGSLLLAELAASDPIKRGSLVMGVTLDGLARHDDYLRARGDEGEDVTAARDGLAERIREDEKFARARGYSARHREPDQDIKALAVKHGRSSDIGMFLVSHQFVHGASGVVLDRVGREGDTAVIGERVEQAKPWARSYGVFAVRSTLHAASALYAILGWTRTPELDALMRAVGLQTARAGPSEK